MRCPDKFIILHTEVDMDEIERKYITLTALEQMYSRADIAKKLGIDIERVKELEEKTKPERDHISAIRKLYTSKKFNNIGFREFYEIYEKLPKECHYCGISQEEINELFDRGEMKPARNGKRGRKLELERVMPKESYENTDNLKLACYWCNNAKTDQFSEDEFKLIAVGIGKALKARLSKL